MLYFSVSLLICLSVCLSEILFGPLWTFYQSCVCWQRRTDKCLKSSASTSDPDIFKNISTLRDRSYSIFWPICSGKSNWSDICRNFINCVSTYKNIPVKFRQIAGYDLRLWSGITVVVVCALWVLLFVLMFNVLCNL